MRTLRISREKIYSGELILVNSTHPYKDNMSDRRLVSVREDYSNIKLDRRVSIQLDSLICKLDARTKIVPVSGFRGMQEQSDIYEDSLREGGVGYTTNYVALPGCSEHHTGLAIDLAEYTEDIDFICPKFSHTGVCAEFRKNAASYGFIERYQAGKESTTGVAEEPWHFRYVGYPHARIIEEKGMALEEYIEYLKMFDHKDRALRINISNCQYEIFFIKQGKTQDNFEVQLEENVCCQVSGNNENGIIVTSWQPLAE